MHQSHDVIPRFGSAPFHDCSFVCSNLAQAAQTFATVGCKDRDLQLGYVARTQDIVAFA